jgi:shikimate dehydrogenase
MPRLAVIGHPVAHSRSPAMQNAALAALGLGESWTYEAIDVPPEGLEARLRAMAAEGFAGANVTVPHKEAALALADVPSREAQAIGAANTLVFADAGIEAHNTDAAGLLGALLGVGPDAEPDDAERDDPGREQAPGGGASRGLASPQGKRALVLGAGGAARAAVWALSSAGAVVDIWNRTASRADAVYAEMREFLDLGGAPVDSPDQGVYGIVVNTTTVGLHGEDPFAHLPLRADRFGEQVVVDMVYGERPSALLAVAAAGGASTVDGIEVLVQQGALSLRIWTEREPPIDVMRAAARA